MIDGSLCVSGATLVSIDLDDLAGETGRTLGCCGTGDDRAVAAAVSRVLRRGAHRQRRQLVAGPGELGQPGLHLGQPAGDQLRDADAGRLAAVADAEARARPGS